MVEQSGCRRAVRHQNIAFPVVVAGDANRAAFGFVGTNAPGNSQDGATFRGIWHLYIATTFDGGGTYNTVDVTPNDPVQVGSICISGTTCGSDRNLLDFNDFAVDKEGRGVLAYADGCVAPQCNASSSPNASRSAKATIARQSGGKRLFERFDTAEPAVPAAPRLESATRILRALTSYGQNLTTAVHPSPATIFFAAQRAAAKR
jgi:hypothetical protein